MPRTPAQRAYYQRQRETRRAEGLCLTCGKYPADPNKTLCSACREKCRDASQRYNDANRDARRASWRTYQQNARDERTAQNLCPACGKRPPAPDFAVCTSCHLSNEQRDQRHREKLGRARVPHYDGDPKTYPFRLGKERPKLSGKVHRLRFALDAWAYLTIRQHMKDMRERDRAEGRAVRRDAISLLVRTMILQHEYSPCPVHRQTEEMHEHRLGVSLDDRTIALLDAHAARHYDGNRSKALRDFLIAAKVPPKWIASVGGPRRSPRYADEDDFS